MITFTLDILYLITVIIYTIYLCIRLYSYAIFNVQSKVYTLVTK